jgi:hypothetical protein
MSQNPVAQILAFSLVGMYFRSVLFFRVCSLPRLLFCGTSWAAFFLHVVLQDVLVLGVGVLVVSVLGIVWCWVLCGIGWCCVVLCGGVVV